MCECVCCARAPRSSPGPTRVDLNASVVRWRESVVELELLKREDPVREQCAIYIRKGRVAAISTNDLDSSLTSECVRWYASRRVLVELELVPWSSRSLLLKP